MRYSEHTRSTTRRRRLAGLSTRRRTTATAAGGSLIRVGSARAIVDMRSVRGRDAHACALCASPLSPLPLDDRRSSSCSSGPGAAAATPFVADTDAAAASISACANWSHP